jgi:polyisoprenoid-binding protein YceI
MDRCSFMPTSPARNARTWRQVSRHVALVCTLTLLSYTGTRGAIAAQSWGIDEAHTSIGFKIDAVGFPTTLGHFSHYSGRILIDLEHPLKSFTTFTVDSASVDLGSKSFNDFVKSSLLLNAEKFPTIGFTSTQVEKLDPRTARVSGNLTMLGVTKPITLTVNVDRDPMTKGRTIGFCRKSDPDVMVVQSAEDRQRKNAADGLDGSGYGESLANDRCVRVPL